MKRIHIFVLITLLLIIISCGRNQEKLPTLVLHPHEEVSGSIDLNELRELGLRLEEGFYMGVFRADYRKDGSVNWYSAVITDDETADFHKPDMLFKAILKK